MASRADSDWPRERCAGAAINCRNLPRSRNLEGMGRLLVLAIPVAITVYAFIDVVTTRPRTTRRGPKLLWAFAVLLLPLIGAILWFVFGRPRKVRTAPQWSAPDDDVEFLRGLSEELRHTEDDEGPSKL